jgi:hypothetical protein
VGSDGGVEAIEEGVGREDEEESEDETDGEEM